jgi:hypothetical protein
MRINAMPILDGLVRAATARPIRRLIVALACSALALAGRFECKGANPERISPGILIERAGMRPIHEDTVAAIKSTPARGMGGPGLAGAMGGVRLKALRIGAYELLVPLPQMADSQIPVSYTIVSKPTDAIAECRLRTRGDSNVAVGVRLSGKPDQEIEITWTSVVLVARKADVGKPDRPEPYLRRTSCVQSDAKEITKLANELWPANGKIDAFAREIQRFIGKMQQKHPPRSTDALNTLDSGANWICTANANLATALLRAKGIPARSIAVIPTISKRLEMHRIVEYVDHGQWITFDPSSLQKEIPAEPWRNVIMAKTTIADEDAAMKPRPGSALGCPFGQESEFPDQEAGLWGMTLPGVTLWGNDFFWTTAKPLAEFGDTEETISLARKEWTRFLETGKLSNCQRRAVAARNANAFLDALRAK